MSHADLPARQLVFPEDEHQPRLQPVGPLHLRLERSALVLDLGVQSRPPQVPKQLERREPRGFAQRGHEHIGPGGGNLQLLGEREDEALDAGRKANAHPVGAAQLLHQAVVTPAAEDRVLGAELAGEDLESRPGVVVETAHEPMGHRVGNPVEIKRRPHGVEVRAALGAQVVHAVRQRIDGGLVAWHLAVEDAQRVGRRPPLAVAAELANILAESGHERGAEGGTAHGAPNAVDRQIHPGNPERRDQHPRQIDHLGVHRRVGHAEHLHVELVELPVTPLLRPLVPEHRPHRVELGDGHRLLEGVLHEGAHHAGRRLGTEGDALAALVGERVHLLLHDVRGLAGSLREQLLALDDRRPDLEVSVLLEHAARGGLDERPALHFSG